MSSQSNKKVNKVTSVSSKDGGFLYTFIVISILLVSVVFSTVLSVIPDDKSALFSDVKTIISYFLGPIAVCLAIGILRYKSKNETLFALSKNFNIKPLIATICIFFGLTFSLSNLNEWFVEFLINCGFSVKTPTLPSKTPINVVLVIISVCILPALVEEFAFRHLILRSLSKTGVMFATLISGALFAFFHMSPAQTIYQFLVGSIYSLIIIYGGNLLYVISIHFLNNLYVVLNYYFFNFNFDQTTTVILTILGFVSLILGIFLLVKNRKVNEVPKLEKKKNRLEFLYGAVMGAVAVLVMWIQGLING